MMIIPQSRKRWWKRPYFGRILRFSCGEVTCDDALDFLNSVRDECADIIFLDPPFNLGKRYGDRTPKDDRLDDEAYMKYMTAVLWRACAVLKPGGAVYLYHIPKWAIRFAAILDKELTFRHWIAVSMKNGSSRARHLIPAHYALLYYTKGEPSHFTLPQIPIAKCRRCGESVKDYGGYKRFLRNGLNLSDLWEDMSPVRHRQFKHRRANELPVKLLGRVVQISGVPGGVLIDPFAGAGTSLIVAAQAGMRFVGNDKEESFLNVIHTRLTTRRQPFAPQ